MYTIFICIYTYIYIITNVNTCIIQFICFPHSLSLSLYIYIYIYICVCVCVLVGSYPSTKMQSVYSTGPTNRANEVRESLLLNVFIYIFE